MSSTTLDWKADETLAVGKGATVQQFVATLGPDKLAIDVAPWGEGHLKVNGREIAHVDHAKDRREAFREMKKAADDYVSRKSGAQEKTGSAERKEKSSAIPAVKAKLLEGKRGLVV